MELITPTPDQIGYVFGQYILVYLIVYVFTLGRKRAHDTSKPYMNRIVVSAVVTGVIYAFVSRSRGEVEPKWLIISGLTAMVLTFIINYADYKIKGGAGWPRVLRIAFNGAITLALIIGASFPLAYVAANANAREDMRRGFENAVSKRPDGEVYLAMLRKSPQIYDEFIPLAASAGKMSGGELSELARKKSAEIFTRHIKEYHSKASDAELANAWSKSTALMDLAVGHNPINCLPLLNGAAISPPSRTPSIDNAVIEAVQATVQLVRNTDLKAPVRPVDEAAAGQLIAQTAGEELLSSYNRPGTAEQEQCVLEVTMRKKTLSLPEADRAMIARMLYAQ
jgi:hypothetical protein